MFVRMNVRRKGRVERPTREGDVGGESTQRLMGGRPWGAHCRSRKVGGAELPDLANEKIGSE